MLATEGGVDVEEDEKKKEDSSNASHLERMVKTAIAGTNCT